MKPFIDEFVRSDGRDLYIVGIDECVKSGYSHVVLLTHAMKRKSSIVQHSVLMAEQGELLG
jgi:hypothetical protein